MVRMLGKAVKFRHCPATVSALASKPVIGQRQETSQSTSRRVAGALKTTGGNPPGRELDQAQVRRPVLGAPTACVPRGTKEPACPFPNVRAPQLVASLLSFSSFFPPL